MGFTLIELLAVIVILAVIALIATPIVLDIIDDSNKSSVEASMKNIERAVLLEYSRLELNKNQQEEIVYNCYDGECIYNGSKINIKGNLPDRGRIIVDESGVAFENIIIKGYNCIKKDDKYTCNNTGLTTVNGTDIVINNNKTTEIEDYKIYGNSIQNGEPTPDNPVEIENVGDLVTTDNCSNYGEDACNNVGKYVIPIKVTGKNYNSIPIHEYNYSIDYKKYNNHNSIILNKGIYTLSGDYLPIIQFFNIKTGDRLLVQDAVLYNKNEYYSAWDDYALLVTVGSSAKTTTITLLDNLEITLSSYYGVIENFQIEYGDESTEYEPYKERIYNIYLDEPLRKIGEYADFIDFKNKKVVRKIKKITLNGEENWQSYPYSDYSYLLDNLAEIKKYNLLMNNYFKVDSKAFNLRPAIRGRVDSPFGRLYIFDNSDNTLFSSLDGLKNWLQEKYLSGNPLNVNYVLETLIEEDIKLPNILLNEDTSVISINTNIEPSNVEIIYYR